MWPWPDPQTWVIRIEKEYLPAPAGYTIKSINFIGSRQDRASLELPGIHLPRQMEVFGSYGVVNDVISSACPGLLGARRPSSSAATL